nr:MAG TPA: hypothetical protein [Caudoviricetes sp.]
MSRHQPPASTRMQRGGAGIPFCPCRTCRCPPCGGVTY